MPAFNFQKQFAPAVESGEKRQTIRAHRKDGRIPAKRGDTLALYTGMRTKACRKLIDATCTAVLPIEIQSAVVRIGDGCIRFGEDGRDLDEFARADGFSDWFEMSSWFLKTHGTPFSGHLIRWEPPISPIEQSEQDGNNA